MAIEVQFIVIGETITRSLKMTDAIPSVGDIVTLTEGTFVVVSREFLIDEYKIVLTLNRK